jgi:hypothetical protein
MILAARLLQAIPAQSRKLVTDIRHLVDTGCVPMALAGGEKILLLPYDVSEPL